MDYVIEILNTHLKSEQNFLHSLGSKDLFSKHDPYWEWKRNISIEKINQINKAIEQYENIK